MIFFLNILTGGLVPILVVWNTSLWSEFAVFSHLQLYSVFAIFSLVACFFFFFVCLQYFYFVAFFSSFVCFCSLHSSCVCNVFHHLQHAKLFIGCLAIWACLAFCCAFSQSWCVQLLTVILAIFNMLSLFCVQLFALHLNMAATIAA